MGYAIGAKKAFFGFDNKTKGHSGQPMSLAEARISEEYTVQDIKTGDEELKDFLFTLGCYAGEQVTIISELGENFVISVKDARYSIDKELAEAIVI